MSAKSATSRAASSAEATLEELRGLLAEAEKALSSNHDAASEEVSALRTRLREAVEEGKASARHAIAYAKEQAAHADEAIRTHPYAAIGIAAGIGLLAGVIIGRNGCSR